MLALLLQDNFSSFFIEQRLVPQLEIAVQKLSHIHPGTSELSSYSSLERLIEAVRKILAPVEHIKPCLLHGGESSLVGDGAYPFFQLIPTGLYSGMGGYIRPVGRKCGFGSDTCALCS